MATNGCQQQGYGRPGLKVCRLGTIICELKTQWGYPQSLCRHCAPHLLFGIFPGFKKVRVGTGFDLPLEILERNHEQHRAPQGPRMPLKVSIATIDQMGLGSVVAAGLAHDVDRDARKILRLTPASHRDSRHDVLDESIPSKG